MRYRALVAYDGTDFAGWQSQAGNQRTVQETLAAALSQVLREPVTPLAAGRTDAGVHARGQVVAFDVARQLPDPARVQHSINCVLPEDVALRELKLAEPDFDPRRHACLRVYRYRLWNELVRPPFERRTSWHIAAPLDLEAMGEAAAAFVGEHDFTSFQGADKIERPSVRLVARSEFVAEGALVTYWVEANAFVRHMVRNFVGQLVAVGLGSCRAEEVQAILASRDRTCAAPPAPPEGLFLERVDYE